jgi:hypothetical protein
MSEMLEDAAVQPGRRLNWGKNNLPVFVVKPTTPCGEAA